MKARLLSSVLCLAGVCCYESEAFGYAQSANMPVHQWQAVQGQLFFRSQFGPSQIDSFVGEAIAYPTGNNNRFAEGTFDEDESDNPYGQTQPFGRHFWAHNAGFRRVHDDGLQAFDSAMSRAIQYVNGGNDILNAYQGPGLLGCATAGGWSCGQNSARDQGIVWSHQNDTGNNAMIGRAYYWLGNAAHLLQDLSLPAHSHPDAHLELGGTVLDDPDPVHDWVDGRPFRTDGNTAMGARGTAAFDDTTASRWEQWAFHATQRGIGRAGGTIPLDTNPIRSPQNFIDLRPNLPLEQRNSIPTRPTAAADQAVYDQALPLYIMGLELSGRVDNFDSDDVNGQVNPGVRRNAVGDNDNNQYNNWTQAELNEVADVSATSAIRATAELIRYFYSLVDTTAPNVMLPNLPANQNDALVYAHGQLTFQAQAADPLSGHDLDGFRFALQRFDGTNWNNYKMAGPSEPQFAFNATKRGLYRLQADVENGGGRVGTSAFGYFQVVPEPTAGSLIFSALVMIATLRRRLKTPHSPAYAEKE